VRKTAFLQLRSKNKIWNNANNLGNIICKQKNKRKKCSKQLTKYPFDETAVVAYAMDWQKGHDEQQKVGKPLLESDYKSAIGRKTSWKDGIPPGSVMNPDLFCRFLIPLSIEFNRKSSYPRMLKLLFIRAGFASYLHWRIKYKHNLCVRSVVWSKKLAPCISSHEVEVGTVCLWQKNIRSGLVPSGATIASWRDQLELVYRRFSILLLIAVRSLVLTRGTW
jgi:hypothetical protein